MTQHQKIANLQSFAENVNFMVENSVYDFSALAEKSEQMFDETRQLADDVKKIDRRLGALETHLAHYDIMQQHKAVALKVKTLKGKKHDDYLAKYGKEIAAYKNSTKYFKRVLTGRTVVPVKEWKNEKNTLTAERVVLGEKFYDLKDEIKVVEKLRRNADKLMREIAKQRPARQKHKARDIDR
ncbi:MAG: hypothetical protein FWB92_12895 [Oscillospiraceae bacterium]|nr:hypothetical protein [Oscillospiraceae bacterium]